MAVGVLVGRVCPRGAQEDSVPRLMGLPEGDPTADEQAVADLLRVRYADVVRALLPEMVAMAADEIASRRRRSFRWCRSCRRVHPPEWFVGTERVCQHCEAAFEQFDA